MSPERKYTYQDKAAAQKSAKASHAKQKAKFKTSEEYSEEMRRRANKRYGK